MNKYRRVKKINIGECERERCGDDVNKNSDKSKRVREVVYTACVGVGDKA